MKELSVFKTKDTMTSLKLSSFKDGIPDMVDAVPPIISNKEQAEAIADNAEQASDILEIFNSGNFFLMVILGGSMQQLYGMIRAIQLISLPAVIDIKMPVNMFIFMQICIMFAAMDILQGEDIIAFYFTFHETLPVN
jgi:hypothetical protein